MVGFDWSQYSGNLKWLPSRTLFLTLHGSHAYGTNTPESDSQGLSGQLPSTETSRSEEDQRFMR